MSHAWHSVTIKMFSVLSLLAFIVPFFFLLFSCVYIRITTLSHVMQAKKCFGSISMFTMAGEVSPE